MTLDLDAIERAAKVALIGVGPSPMSLHEALRDFHAAANPSAVLALVREVRELRAEREKSLAPLREWLEGLRTIKFCGGGTVPLYRRMLTLMRAALAGDPT